MKNFISITLIVICFFSLQLHAAERAQPLKSGKLNYCESVNWRKLFSYASKIKQHASDINGTAQILARYHSTLPSRYIGCSATGEVAIVRDSGYSPSTSTSDLSPDCMRLYPPHNLLDFVTISPDGSACCYHSLNGDTVTLYRSDGRRQQLTNLNHIGNCYFSFGCRYLAVVLGSYAKLFERNDDGIYRECSLAFDCTYRKYSLASEIYDGIRKLVFAPHRIITSRCRGSINFYHYDGSEAEEDLSICGDKQHYVGDIEYSVLGDLLAAVVTTYTDGRTPDCTSVVKMFDLRTRCCLYEIGNIPGAVFVKFSPTYPIWALYSNQFNGVKVYGMHDGKLLADLATPGNVSAIQFSPDGDHLYASGYEMTRDGAAAAVIKWNLDTVSYEPKLG